MLFYSYWTTHVESCCTIKRKQFAAATLPGTVFDSDACRLHLYLLLNRLQRSPFVRAMFPNFVVLHAASTCNPEDGPARPTRRACRAGDLEVDLMPPGP